MGGQVMVVPTMASVMARGTVIIVLVPVYVMRAMVLLLISSVEASE